MYLIFGVLQKSCYIVPVAETVFVIPAKAGIQFFALDPCFRRGDIVDFRFPQQILYMNYPKLMGIRTQRKFVPLFIRPGLSGWPKSNSNSGVLITRRTSIKNCGLKPISIGSPL